VKKVAAQYNCLWAGGLSATNIYGHGGSKKDVQEYFKEQAEILVRHGCDFFIVEVGRCLYPGYSEENAIIAVLHW
jgi:hypothetical protein